MSEQSVDDLLTLTDEINQKNNNVGIKSKQTN